MTLITALPSKQQLEKLAEILSKNVIRIHDIFTGKSAKWIKRNLRIIHYLVP